jgi:hypothetical protein
MSSSYANARHTLCNITCDLHQLLLPFPALLQLLLLLVGWFVGRQFICLLSIS